MTDKVELSEKVKGMVEGFWEEWEPPLPAPYDEKSKRLIEQHREASKKKMIADLTSILTVAGEEAVREVRDTDCCKCYYMKLDHPGLWCYMFKTRMYACAQFKKND